ncbi:hypothetical protein HYY75_09615 [bacterium]|nr:hypothetical protein [bacterium]
MSSDYFTPSQRLVEDFGVNVEALTKTRPNDKIMANFDSDYPLKGRQTWGFPSSQSFVQPKFFDLRNNAIDFTIDDSSVFPFAFKSLISAKLENAKFLEKAGILKKGRFS